MGSWLIPSLKVGLEKSLGIIPGFHLLIFCRAPFAAIKEEFQCLKTFSALQGPQNTVSAFLLSASRCAHYAFSVGSQVWGGDRHGASLPHTLGLTDNFLTFPGTYN